MEIKQITIKQITTDGSLNGRIFGLGEDNKVYLWIALKDSWVPYNEDYQHATSN